jgi:HD domain
MASSSDRVSTENYVIHSLSELLALIEIVPPDDLRLATDLKGDNKTILVRSGQALSSSAINYLKTHNNYDPRFVIEPTLGLTECCRTQIRKAIQELVVSKKTRALTQAILLLGKDIMPLVNISLQDSRRLFSLFSMKYFGNENENSLFDHLFIVGVLSVGICRFLDSGFLKQEKAIDAMLCGLVHDVSLIDYNERIGLGQDALEDEPHQLEAAKQAEEWGLNENVIYAVSNHHSYKKDKDSIPPPPNSDAATLHTALVTAEFFVTLFNVLGKEDSALFLLGHHAEQGLVDRKALKALAELIKSKDIVDHIVSVAELENLCPCKAAYAYPKVVRTTPTQVICKANEDDCPHFLSSVPPLNVISTMKGDLCGEGLISLPQGTYAKCALSEKLAALFSDNDPQIPHARTGKPKE